MKRRNAVTAFLIGLLLAGCGTQKEEEIVITQVESRLAEVTFSLDQNWEILKEEENQEEAAGLAAYELIAQNKLTYSSIMVLTEDLTRTEGKELILTEDYVREFQIELSSREEYSYTCSPMEIKTVYGEEYYTFLVQVSEPKAKQYYCIRRSEDRMIVLIFTGYGEEPTEQLVNLGRPI